MNKCGLKKKMPKTGEDGGGWYRTLTWHHDWTRQLPAT